MSNKENMGRGIVLFSTRNYLFALGTFLINLQKYISYDGVIVYHDGFTKEEQNAIIKIDSKVRFIEYNLGIFAKEFDLNEEDLKSIFFIQRYTVLAVIKFKIFQHLNEFSTVMLFDLDMLLLDRLDELLDKDFDIAWRNDAVTIRDKLNYCNYSDESIKQIGMYDIYSKAVTPNAGFFVVNRTFDHRKVYSECVNYLRNYSFIHPYSIDEVMIGYIKEKMKLRAYDVDTQVYNVFPIHISMKSKLIHCLGEFKPWNRRTVQAVFREWWKNYEHYVAVTNMPSNEVVDFSNISECLVQSYHNEKWNELFQNYGFVYPSDLILKPYLSKPNLSLSYHGLFDYNVEINWNEYVSYCALWIDNDKKSLPIESLKERLRAIAVENVDFVIYREEEKRFGLRTMGRALYDVPNSFYRLYYMTEEIRKFSMVCFANIETYHNTKLYINLDKRCLVHSDENGGKEVYVCLNGGKVALFINMNGMNVYLKEINGDGTVTFTGRQTFFSCTHNQNHSISIAVKNGSLLSANNDGTVSLRHWDREWEHFWVRVVGKIEE